MSEAIIVALITAGASVICQLLISNKTKKDNATAQAVRDKDFEDRLKRIEERLDQHNNYAEKYNNYAEKLNDIQITITAIKKDIEYLKQSK